MALVGQNQQTTFANPQNGQAPDADVIRGNDNALVTKHNAHDADATIHIQTGTLAGRPAAGTAGAVYIDENKRIYVDNGSAWGEVPYARLDAAGTNSFTNNVSVGGNFTVVSGLTDVLDIDAADIVADTATIAGAVSAASVASAGAVTGATATISGAVSGASFTGSGAGLTSIPAGQLTGTVDNARLPSTISGKTIASAPDVGAAKVTINGTDSPFTVTNTSAGTPAFITMPGPDTYLYFTQGGTNSVPSLTNTGPVSGLSDWRWLRLSFNGNTFWIPVLN